MAWFCDWLSGRMPMSEAREVNGGRVVYLDRKGDIEYGLDRRLEVVGSHDARMQVRTVGHDLEFSGNPAKFLQGHNLYGSADLIWILLHLGYALAHGLGVDVYDDDDEAWYEGRVSFSRVDVTRMYRPDFAEPGWVPTWLDLASRQATAYRQRVTNRGAYEGNTMYHGQHSRRISTKLYDKAAELARHPIPNSYEAPIKEGLQAYARDTLRVEVTLRSMELKRRGLNTAAAWTVPIGDAIVDERLSKLSLPEDLRMTEEQVLDLPPRLLAVYEMWRAGHDLRAIYKKSQYYTYRSALLDYDIDIAHVQPREVIVERGYTLGRPLKDFITGPGLEPPPGALEAGLLVG